MTQTSGDNLGVASLVYFRKGRTIYTLHHLEKGKQSTGTRVFRGGWRQVQVVLTQSTTAVSGVSWKI